MTQQEKIEALAEKVMGWRMPGTPKCNPDYDDPPKAWMKLDGEGGWNWTGFWAEEPPMLENPDYFVSYGEPQFTPKPPYNWIGTRVWNPFLDDADCLQVLRQFPDYRIIATEWITTVSIYGLHTGRPIPESCQRNQDHSDPAQCFRSCVCEAALKAKEERK